LETDKRAQTTGEHRQLKSKGNKSVRVQLQDLIDEVTQDNPSMPEFVERLQQQGPEVQVTLTGIGFSKGISYNMGRETTLVLNFQQTSYQKLDKIIHALRLVRDKKVQDRKSIIEQ
jgi:hypothetical protein